MAGTTSLTTRIDSELKAELEQIAKHEDRSASYMANLAIRNLVEERKATRELVELGLEMVKQGMPGIEPKAVHEWMMSDEDKPFPNALPTKL